MRKLNLGRQGFGARDTVKGIGPLTTSVLSRARQTEPVAVLPARLDAEETLHLVLSRLDDMKAEDTVTIDLRGKSSLTDFMIVTTGRANRHVAAIAENVMKGLHEAGIKNVRVEGLQNADWVLIDAGDVVVHVFRAEVREFYNLERMWSANEKPARKRS